MNNSDIAKIFYEIADILEIESIAWKPQAYRKAARSIEQLSESTQDIYSKGGIKALEKISGVGKHIAEKIETLLTTGTLPYYEKLKKESPGHLSDLMHIPSLGPKKVKVLYNRLKITTIPQLLKAIKERKVAKLPGFGEKTEQDILKGIELHKKRKTRALLGEALPIAESLVKKLKTLDSVKKAMFAGSLRRMQETIGDIDILVTSRNPKEVMDFFTSLQEVERVLAKGNTKSSIILHNNIQVDLRVVKEESFGAAMQYFTGDKQHNIKMRNLAIKKGMKLSEYGLFKKDKLIEGKSEKKIYSLLCKDYIQPEMRTNTGEIELAIKRSLPKLIGYSDLKADLHMHTKWSDGLRSIEDMAKHAKNLGYEYIAITDHSKSQHIAHGMDESRLKKYIKEVKKVDENISGLKVLAGCEVDILKEGNLDFSDSILKKLDIVIASVHSGFKMQKEKMTGRIIKALSNPYVKILGHPTGRLINQREPYAVDIKKVCKAAADKNVALEINSSPLRLDLNDINAKVAKEQGAKLIISTDSHIEDSMHAILFGIGVARRAGLEKKDVLNSLPFKRFKKVLL